MTHQFCECSFPLDKEGYCTECKDYCPGPCPYDEEAVNEAISANTR